MNWEEAVIFLRGDKAMSQLVKDAYLDEDLERNVSRFRESEEFHETLRLIEKYTGKKTGSVLDIGAGNGTSCAALALCGWEVTCIEPDTSNTVGTGAILQLKEKLKLTSLRIEQGVAERMPFHDSAFDLVYTRQCLHHAADLQTFAREAARVLKKGGIFFSLRDHVVNDEKQLQQFLSEHPLHRYYGGEHAFTLAQYRSAIQQAGLKILKTLGPLDSVINFAPKTKKQLAGELRDALAAKAGIKFPVPGSLLIRMIRAKTNNLGDNPGRLYSFIARK